jgi:hypothetical protein
MALIAQSCPKYLSNTKCTISSPDVKRLISRIAGFILEDIVSCFEDTGESIVKLLRSMKSGKGKVSPDLVTSVLDMEPNSIPLLPSKRAVARYLLLS